jgi:hypothetical protein
VPLLAAPGVFASSPGVGSTIAALVKSLSPDIRLVAMRLLGALAATEWGARELCASEGTLEVLTTSSDEHRLLSPLELREKHGIAKAILHLTYGASLRVERSQRVCG